MSLESGALNHETHTLTSNRIEECTYWNAPQPQKNILSER